MLTSALWTPVLANMCSICFYNGLADLAVMPDMFRSAVSCDFFCILAAAMGTVAHPWALEGGIAQANKLYLKGGEMHVVIPSGAAWSSLCCTDCEELDIRHVFFNPQWVQASI